MDPSHINRVGQELYWLEELPCCDAANAGAYAHLKCPSHLAYTQLVDELPCFCSTNLQTPRSLPTRHNVWNIRKNYERHRNSKSLSAMQKHALDTFHVIHADVLRDSTSTVVTLADLMQYATCFDNFLFGGCLMWRCDIQFYTEPPETHGGEVVSFDKCDEHQQTHTMQILLTRPAGELTLRARKERLVEMLGLLLHEMVSILEYAMRLPLIHWSNSLQR